MDDLAALLAAERSSREKLTGGRRFVRRGELEEASAAAPEEPQRSLKRPRSPSPERSRSPERAAAAEEPEPAPEPGQDQDQDQVQVQDQEDAKQDETPEQRRARKAARRAEREAAAASGSPAEQVRAYFRLLLSAWGDDLKARPLAVKQTPAGRAATRAHAEAKVQLKPLFQKLRDGAVASDILSGLLKIKRHAEAGEFIKANDAYISIAIGNAAWPIGVTQVGLHARSGRERIQEGKIAHALDDEETRKSLTSIKRLVSYAQAVSDVAPSQRVL